MRIKFDARQSFQLEAIDSVCNVFRGQPVAAAPSTVGFGVAPGELFDELGVANNLLLSDSDLLENVSFVQRQNGLVETSELQGRHFSVEMETGTGKTYVYLRTAYELNARYGFKKFVIVVPTVAIREGVQKSIELTRDHLGDLYGKVPCETWTYDSAKLSRLRQFAASNQMQILIVNIDAFNKAKNIINREQDRLSGRRPLEFLSVCRPIVIVDEPQNVESDQSRQAIASLDPTCTLRYSATHRNVYNLVYRLDPVKAYDLRLVKRIEVDSVVDEADFNKPFIQLDSIEATTKSVSAVLHLDVLVATKPVRRKVKVNRNGLDLFDLSGEREIYRGYVIDCIDAGNRYVSFTNGIVLSVGEVQGGNRDHVMRAQVRETVKEHLEKELSVRQRLPSGRRLKVLSLFFIDRVANYVPQGGKIRLWFVEAYTELAVKPRYAELQLPHVDAVHGGYFSSVKGSASDTTGATAADDESYALIMKDKERLLTLEVPLRFIFSHSALREGWDNPNVFQICTLAEAKSEVRKRQEIGRGLRLPVDETGERCSDDTINRLTVIANESYERFAADLQTEIEEECGVKFTGRIGNKRDRRSIQLKKGWRTNAEFVALWERIKHKTRYSVTYSSPELVRRAAAAIAAMPPTSKPKVVARKVEMQIDRAGVRGSLRSIRQLEMTSEISVLPDVLGYLQRETELTRGSLAKILEDSKRLSDVLVNPQGFLDSALNVVKSVMQDLMVSGIKYERIANAEYEMYLFEQQEVDGYVSKMLDIKKSIFESLEFDSDVERAFAEELEAREDIRLFVKLPRWFKIETPLGTYNPDWAIVKETDGKVYLVRETKGSIEELKLRPSEWGKILCGKEHFSHLGVDFSAVTNAGEV